MSHDFFQCLICHSFFGNLWKVEKHIKRHERDGIIKDRTESSSSTGRRRGMLPIKKVTFLNCSVPVVKNQIDPVFLAQYSEVVAKDEPVVKQDLVADDFLELFDEELKTDVKGVSANDIAGHNNNGMERKPRRSCLQARAKIRRAAAILKIPDQQNDLTEEQNEDMELIDALLMSGDEDDMDFAPPSYVNKIYSTTEERKRGRPMGSKSKRIENLATRPKSTRKRKASTKWKSKDGRPPNSLKWKSCEYCSESFPTKTSLNVHLIESHQDQVNVIVCPVKPCSKPLLNFDSVRGHLKIHTDAERREFAVQEKFNFTKNAEEQDQKPDIQLIGGLVCKFCLEKYSSLSAFQAHVAETHNDNTLLMCPCCNKDTPEDGVINFIGHLKGFHPERIDPFNERIKMTEERRKMEKRFKCDKCERAFNHSSQLRTHVKFHEKILATNLDQESDPERRFLCPVCHRRFKYKDNLRRHFTIHLENNPFVCDFPNCHRKFNGDYNLRRHKALHYETNLTTQRVFCPLCSTSFSRKDKLPRHLRECHKPSEIGIARNGLPGKHQTRLPHVRRVPLYPTHAQSDKTDVEACSRQNEENRQVVKHEADQPTIAEEIHLVDKIILGSDGIAIHVKGEHLTPEQDALLVEDTASDTPDVAKGVLSSSVTLPTQQVSLTSLITSDPLFEKLSKDDPKKVKDFITRFYYPSGKTFNCHLCEAVFSRAWSLQLHLKTIHNQSILDQKQSTNEPDASSRKITLMCGQCAYPVKDSKELAKHVKKFHPPKVKCVKCGINFPTQKRLDVHVQEIHAGARNFKCQFCSKAFTTECYVKNHELKVHNRSAKPAVKKRCPIPGCNMMLAPTTFYYHVKRHEAKKAQENGVEGKYKCNLCGDELSCGPSLRRHIDGVHLGKPINILNNLKYGRGGVKSQKGTVVRRGHKKPGDEWFQPLLQKALGYKPNEDCNEMQESCANEAQNQLDGNSGNGKEADEGLATSILGF